MEKPGSSGVYDAKILVGQKNAHGLPDYSHTPFRKYIKENPDGTFREMRIYGDKGQPLLEIGYHPEPVINNGNRKDKVLHYHILNAVTTMNITRSPAQKLEKDSEIYATYEKYLRRYGL